MNDPFIKHALVIAAHQRQCLGNYQRRITEPVINRNHVDGPCFTALDGQTAWLTIWERLMTKFGVWDAWDIEWRRFPLLNPGKSAGSEGEG